MAKKWKKQPIYYQTSGQKWSINYQPLNWVPNQKLQRLPSKTLKRLLFTPFVPLIKTKLSCLGSQLYFSNDNNRDYRTLIKLYVLFNDWQKRDSRTLLLNYSYLNDKKENSRTLLLKYSYVNDMKARDLILIVHV